MQAYSYKWTKNELFKFIFKDFGHISRKATIQKSFFVKW